MRVLVACEFSGVVRRAFRNLGHDAWSCDLLPAEDASPFHILGDCLPWLKADWGLVIAHPPCTDLAVSGRKVVPIIEGLIGPQKCPTCRGSGKVYDTTRGPDGGEELCPSCFGEGDGPAVSSQDHCHPKV